MRIFTKDKIMDFILALFGLFIAYQLIRKIFGGSWQAESLIIALLVLNLGIILRLSSKFEGHIGWHKGKGDKK